MKQKLFFAMGIALVLVSLVLAVPGSLQAGTIAVQNAAVSAISTFQESAISALQCADTDSSSPLEAGRVYSQKGISAGKYAGTENEGSWEDYCKNDYELVEYFCGGSQSKVKFNRITCLSGCNDGACASPPYCIDKDGGISDKVKGNVFVISSGINEFSPGLTPTQDTCLDSSMLNEYSCDLSDPSGIKSTQIPCEFGCAGGKCKRVSDQTAVQESIEELPTVADSARGERSQPADPVQSVRDAQPSGEPIVLTLGQAVRINGISVSLNADLSSLMLAEDARLRLGVNRIDGTSFKLVAP